MNKYLLLFFSFTLCIAAACNSKNTNTQEKSESRLSSTPPAKQDSIKLLGRKLVKQTFDTLRTTLLAAIEESDIQSAISVCKMEAASLTSVYESANISINRSSLKARNPENRPDELERSQLTYLAKMAAQGKSIDETVISDQDGSIHYFKSIIIQPLCLNCHGKPNEEIAPSTLSTLKSLYPEDQAIDYTLNDFRGVWHVQFGRPME